MLEKIKKFFKKTPEQKQEAGQGSKPIQTVEKTEETQEKKPDFPDTMLLDEKILRCFVLYAEHVYSTAVKELGGSCKYIYVQPGEIWPNKNIDFVQYVYASYGINLKKHISHLNGKETEVLYISSQSYVEDLNKTQQQFLERTAPNIPYFYDMRDRDKEAFDRAIKLQDEIGRKMYPEFYKGR